MFLVQPISAGNVFVIPLFPLFSFITRD